MLYGSMIFIGIFLIVAYSQMQQRMHDVDINSTEARALQGLYTLGVVLLSSGIAFVETTLASGKGLFHSDHARPKTPILVTTLILGLVLLVLSSILVSKLSGTAKSWAIVTLVMGILMMSVCGLMLSGKYTKLVEFEFCSL